LEVLYQSTQRNKSSMDTDGPERSPQGDDSKNQGYLELLRESRKFVNSTYGVCQDDIIRRYKKQKSIEDRKALVEKYSYLVSYCVRRMSMFLPPHIEADDLMSEGIIGLIDAIEKFKEEKGTEFASYATTRIRGSIIDFLRQKDWVPRNVRELAKDIEKAKAYLENEKKRTPTLEELAEYLKISPAKLSYYLNKVKNTEVVSLEEMIRLSGSFEASLPFASQESKGGVEREVEKKERIGILKGAISSLKSREKLILSLYYFEELTLKEIQQILGISMPRISQIHKSVLKKLKEALRDKREILITE